MQAPNVNSHQKAAAAKGVKAIGKKKVTLAFRSLFIEIGMNALSHITYWDFKPLLSCRTKRKG